MHAVGQQRRDKPARGGLFVENLPESHRRNQKDFARLRKARALRQRDVPCERGFRFLVRLQNIGDVLLLGFVAGCGRIGKLLIDVFTSQQVPYVAIEQDANLVAQLRAQGVTIVYGNAARAEMLTKLNAGEAAAVVITMDQPALAMHAVRAIRIAYPQLPVFARSRDLRESSVSHDGPQSRSGAGARASAHGPRP